LDDPFLHFLHFVSTSLVPSVSSPNKGVSIGATFRMDSVSLPSAAGHQHRRSMAGGALTSLVGILASLIACLVLGMALGAMLNRPAVRPPSPPSIQQIREVGLLSTLSVEVADVREVHIDGVTGSVRLILILRGDALLGVDLTKALVVSSDEGRKELVLQLPLPSVITCRLDTQSSSVYRLDHTGLWAMHPQDELTTRLINNALSDAQQAVQHAAEREDLLDLSRRQTQVVIGRYVHAIGWNAQIRWQER